MTSDVIVIGLGGMGSSAAFHLANRGAQVIGLESFTPAHNRGSSHGFSRVIRQAYFEDPAYVPLLLRAYELWFELEARSGQRLLTLTGGLMLGKPESQIVRGSHRSALDHGLPHELLTAEEITKRFPPIRPISGEVGLYEPNAGFVRPEGAVRAQLSEARKLGADLHFEERVLSWDTSAKGVRVLTDRNTYEAGSLVVTAGAWLPSLFPEFAGKLVPERQVMYWFEPSAGIEPFLPDRFPVFIYESAPGEHVYGLPAQPGEISPKGVKVAYYRQPDPCDPDSLNRTVSADEIAKMREGLSSRLPSLNGELVDAMACMYTMSPDQHFVVGRHPSLAHVTVASPCSGHGFKFCPVIGEIIADLALSNATHHPIELFSPLRILG